MQALYILLLAALGTSGSNSVLMEFTQPGCGACARMKPVVKQLEREHVAVRRVDVSRERHLIQRYRITSFPTYVVMSGGRESMRLQGVTSIAVLRDALANRTSQRLRNTGARNMQPQAPQTRLAAVPVGLSQRIAGVDSASSEVMPSLTLAAAIERAQAATVRIRVREAGAVGVATGTVIDNHGEESLVLTCGHVFRDSQGRAPIEVDVYRHGQVVKVPGQLVDYDADARDIALVSIRPGFHIEPVPVVTSRSLPASGSTAFSFGCDRGADPSRRDTRITAVNKYNQHVGASNLEIAGAPTIGRSGGGLFDQQGRIVGVCNAADFEDDIGIYTGPGSIHWQLDRVDLAQLYTPRSPMPAPPTRLASNSGLASPVTSREVTIIMRDPNRPEQTPQIRKIQNPSAEILQLLR